MADMNELAMTDTALAIIGQSSILSPESVATVARLAPELAQTFRTAQVFRTNTEAVVSVLNEYKHPTADSQYWQAVREQNVMMTELASLTYEARKVEIEVKRLRRRLETETDDIEVESIELEIENKQFILANMARTAADRVRELEMWSHLKAEALPNMRYGTEDVNAHQLEAMRIRFAREAQLVNQHTPPADARNILGLAAASQRMAG